MSAEKVEEQPIEKIKNEAEKATQAESEPEPVRRYRYVVFQLILITLTGTFAALTFLVKAVPALAIDVQITTALQTITTPFFSTLMVWVSWLGYGPQNAIIVLVIVLAFYMSGLHWEAIMAIVAAVFSGAVDFLVKDLIQRPRPTSVYVNVVALLNSYSFPSGHVMFYLCFFGFVGFLIFSLLKPSIKRTLILVFTGLLIILIGVSRIYLGEHWPSDVLGAYLLGALTLVAIIQFYNWGKKRFLVRQPVTPSKTQYP